MMIYKHLVILLICLMLVGGVSAASWYVDKDAGGSNSGTSWSNAWNSFSSISWSSVQPGDTIYISGGSSSKTYPETFTVGASGSSGNYITITKGLESGHNGKVIIDGNGASDVFDFGGYQYIKLSHVRIENGDQNIRMRTSNVIVDNVDLFIHGSRGVDNRGFNNVITNSQFITSSSSSGGQRDGIWSTGGGGHTFSNNYMVNRNPSTNAHSDSIQLYQESQASTIANNFLWQDNTKTSNAQGIYIENSDSSGTYEIYNNVIYFPYAKNGIAIRNSQLDANIIGNTFYQTNSVSANLWIRDDGASSVNNIVIKNNIFYTTSSSSRSLQILETLGSGSEVSGNLFYAPNLASPVYYLNSAVSLSTWNNYGFVGTDYEANPQFTNTGNQDLSLKSNSPSIDKGVSLGAPYSVDINGNTRPVGSGWDIGAYEFGGSGCSPPPPCGAPPPDGCQYSYVIDENGCQVCGGLVCTSPDLNGDGCVSLFEIVAYVGKWKAGSVSLSEVVAGVEQWKLGCP